MQKKTFQFKTQCKGVKSHIQNCINHFGEDTSLDRPHLLPRSRYLVNCLDHFIFTKFV